jgi:neuromedin U receptor 1
MEVKEKLPLIFRPEHQKYSIYFGFRATYVSVLTISAFSLERYLAICHPLHLYAMAGLTRASRIILILWVISIACASPFAIYSDITYRDYPPSKFSK